jgi:1,4-alpha-glucan branching enzyme
VVAVSNFTPVRREGYRLPMPVGGRWREILNTDAADYWGSGAGNLGGITADAGAYLGRPHSALVVLPPLATIYFMSDP